MSEMRDEDTEPMGDNRSGNVCDLSSEAFDARSSLMAATDQVVIPVSSARVFNNIDEYFRKSFGKQNALKHLPPVSDPSVEPPFKRTLVIEPSVSTHKAREVHTVLTKMKTSAAKGPNALLLKCLNNRIKVMIRRRKRVQLFGQRFGWVCGLLIAYDKHHNLCMTDVDEKYQTLSHNNTPIDVCNHIKQVFIRGDNVVLISLV